MKNLRPATLLKERLRFLRNFSKHFFSRTPLVAASVKYGYTVNARFTQGLLLLLFKNIAVKKHLNEHIIYNFSFPVEKSP